jgi:hypothetical protein
MRSIGAGRIFARLVPVKPGVALALAFGAAALVTPAGAAPPTVTPSPGYDARLHEQHAAQSTPAPAYEPGFRPSAPSRRHVKRAHGITH